MEPSSSSNGSTPIFKKKSGIQKRDVRPRGVTGGVKPGERSLRSREEGSNPRQMTDTSATPSRRRINEAVDNLDDEDENHSSSSAVIVKKRRLGAANARNPLLQNATLSRRRQDQHGEDDLDDKDWPSGSNIVGGDGKGAMNVRDDATRTNDWYDEADVPVKKSDTANTRTAASNDDGLYRGAASYSKYTTPLTDGPLAKVQAAMKGPVKAGNSNVRMVTMVDYQPDVCKDYKQTGYCGFGDTCKFLHDRSDYLAGWQMDKLPNSTARQRGDFGIDDDEDNGKTDADKEEIPFACLICRKPFTDPIVTMCGHYFCSACAIKRFSKTSKCFACGKQTQGIFNSAQKVLDRMTRVRAAKEEEREQRQWNKADAPDDVTGGELLEGVEVGDAEDD